MGFSCLSIATICDIGIATAAIEMLAGEAGVKTSRKPEIMADAAYAVMTKPSRELTGQFLIDDDVLAKEGITDLTPYAYVPGEGEREVRLMAAVIKIVYKSTDVKVFPHNEKKYCKVSLNPPPPYSVRRLKMERKALSGYPT